jgi:hypothetical protein
MGNFYTNISLRTDDYDVVIRVLREQHRNAFVTGPRSGWIVIYDKDMEAAELTDVGRFAQKVSDLCFSLSVAVSNYDDDYLWYQVCKGGKLVDEYNSTPGYFGRPYSAPVGGQARVISTILERGSEEPLVHDILHTRSYAVETQRHLALAETLKLPLASVGFGYHYIERGELPSELRMEDLVHLQ